MSLLCFLGVCNDMNDDNARVVDQQGTFYIGNGYQGDNNSNMIRAIFLRARRRYKAVLSVFICIPLLILLFHSNGADESHFQDDRQTYKSSRQILSSNCSADALEGKPEVITSPDKFILRYESKGAMVNKSGVTKTIKTPMMSSLIYSYSPMVENKVKKIFPDPAHQNVFYANSPAIIWHKGKIITVLRIWLEEERYKKKSKPYNYFQDNYFYTQKFDAAFNPVTPGELLGVPTHHQDVGGIGDGPIEPRIFKVNVKEGSKIKPRMFLTFNTAVYFPKNLVKDFTLFWDFDNSELFVPNITNGGVTPTRYGMPRDKHWSAFKIPGERTRAAQFQEQDLFFVQNLDPLRILKCNLEALCSFVYSADNPKDIKFVDGKSHLRGGTPFEHYKGFYYISVAHGTFFKDPSWKRFYTAHIVVLYANPYDPGQKFRVAYLGDNIQVHKTIMTSVPIVRAKYIQDPFIFPVGLILEGDDTLYLGVHISDYSSVILRVRGLKKLMDLVISEDQKSHSVEGIRSFKLQDLVLEMTMGQYGIKFQNH